MVATKFPTFSLQVLLMYGLMLKNVIVDVAMESGLQLQDF